MGNLLNIGIKASGISNLTDVVWQHAYPLTCATRSFAVYKNNVLQASGNGNTYQTGTFQAQNGDVIRIDSTSGASGTSCSGANVEILLDTTSKATNSVTGLNATATASYTINTTQGIWYLTSGLVV